MYDLDRFKQEFDVIKLVIHKNGDIANVLLMILYV